MSDSTLVLTVVVLAFTLPVVYEKEQKQIDMYLKKAQEFMDKYLNMLKTKGSEMKKKVESSDVAQKLDEMENKNK